MSTDQPPRFVIVNDWIAVEVNGCTCAAPEYGEQILHENGCGLEPVMTFAELDRLLRSNREEWCVFYGGPDPDNAAGTEPRDDENDAREHVQWIEADHGRGIAVRHVYFGPWAVVDHAGGGSGV